MLNRFKDYDTECVKGAIIGEADLIDCILVNEKFTDELRKMDPIIYEKSNHMETYAWKLDNIRKYDDVVYIKGNLGLWNYNKEL